MEQYQAEFVNTERTLTRASVMLTAIALVGGLGFSRLDWSLYASNVNTAALVVYRVSESIALLALVCAAYGLSRILLSPKYERIISVREWLDWRSKLWEHMTSASAQASEVSLAEAVRSKLADRLADAQHRNATTNDGRFRWFRNSIAATLVSVLALAVAAGALAYIRART
jgi:hypothetical protein